VFHLAAATAVRAFKFVSNFQQDGLAGAAARSVRRVLKLRAADGGRSAAEPTIREKIPASNDVIHADPLMSESTPQRSAIRVAHSGASSHLDF
jgi:hypothetical protein